MPLGASQTTLPRNGGAHDEMHLDRRQPIDAGVLVGVAGESRIDDMAVGDHEGVAVLEVQDAAGAHPPALKPPTPV